MKTCTKCHIVKNYSRFRQRIGYRDGYRTICKDCDRASAKRRLPSYMKSPLKVGNTARWSPNQRRDIEGIAPTLACKGKCNMTRTECLIKRNVDLEEDSIQMTKLFQRYDSWQQSHKQGYVYLIRKDFNNHKGIFKRK